MYKRLVPLIQALLLATACSRAPTRSVPPPAPEVKSIKLLMQGSEPWLDPMITAFQNQHPEYRIEKVAFRNMSEYRDLLNKGAVDVFSNLGSWEMVTQRAAVTHLGPYISRSRLDTIPYGANVMAGQTVRGQILGLPAFVTPWVLVYNQRLVQEAGVTIPADRWTWEEFRDTATRLTKGTGDDRIWGFTADGVAAEDLAFIQAFGLAPGSPLPDVETARKVFSFWHTMVTVDRSMSPAVPVGSPYPETTLCDQGKAAICFQALNYITMGPHPGEFRLAPVPAVAGQNPVLFVSVTGYGIPAKAADPDAAWALVSFLAGPEGAAILARQGFFPAYASDATRQAWAEATPPPPAGSDRLFGATWHVVNHTYELTEPAGVFYKKSNGVLTGTVPVDDAVAAYEGAVSGK